MSWMMLLWTAVASAAPCPTPVVLGLSGVCELEGTPQVVQQGEVFEARVRNGSTWLIARSEGTGSLSFRDGRHVPVAVTACATRRDSLAAEARMAGFEGLDFACRNDTVVVQTAFEQPPGVAAVLRTWEDTRSVEVRGQDQAPVRLRIQVARSSMDDVRAWGLDFSAPVDLVRSLADAVRGGPGRLSDGMFNGPGSGRAAGTWYQERDLQVEPGDPVSVWIGSAESIMGSGEGTTPKDSETGVQVGLRDVSVLSDGRALRATLSLSLTTPTESGRDGRFYVSRSEGTRQESRLRMRVGEPVELARWSQSEGLDVNDSLPLLDQIPWLDDLLGGHERRDYQGEVLVVATLLTGRSVRSTGQKMDDLRSQGEAQRRAVRGGGR